MINLNFWKDQPGHRMKNTPEKSGTKNKEISFGITAMVLGRDMETWTEAVICNNLAIENLLHQN